MKRWFSNIFSILVISSIGFSGCGIGNSSDKKDDTTPAAAITHDPFAMQYARANSDANATSLVVAFWDGVEIPANHDYLLFGQGSVDKYNTNAQDDDALFARVSSKDGTLKSASYVRYVSQDANNSGETYVRGTTLSYLENGTTKHNIVLIGQARSNEASKSRGILVTLLDGDGTHKWSRLYQITSGYLNDIGDVAADDDGTFWIAYNGYIPVKTYANGYIETAYLGVVMHIDAKTGDILLAKHFGIDDWESGYLDITLANGKVYISGYSHDKSIDTSLKRDGESDTVLLLEIHKDGTLLSANKYFQKDSWILGERGNGIVYKEGKIYIAYQIAGIDGGVMKIDANSKSLQKVMKIFHNDYNSYYRDFAIDGESLYLSANNVSFYKTDLDGNIEKIGDGYGGWDNALFIDSQHNIVALTSNGAAANITSFATKFSDKLEKCGINTKVTDPDTNATDVTDKWVAEEISPTYNDIPVAMATNNTGNFEIGSATNIIAQENRCK